jgi:hypothetical protein
MEWWQATQRRRGTTPAPSTPAQFIPAVLAALFAGGDAAAYEEGSTVSWCCIVPSVQCSTVLCCAVLCCAVLCCAVLCCAVLCCAVLCCAVLCCAVLCCCHCQCFLVYAGACQLAVAPTVTSSLRLVLCSVQAWVVQVKDTVGASIERAMAEFFSCPSRSNAAPPPVVVAALRFGQESTPSTLTPLVRWCTVLYDWQADSDA